MFKIEESKSGVLTFKYKNKYLHSKYDPLRESQIFINKNIQLLENNTIVVYGLGLGYHIENILEKVKDKALIYVFEGNDEIIDICKNIKPDLFKKDNVNIISSKNINFYNIFQKQIQNVKDIIVHKPSLETIKDKDRQLYKLINNYVIDRESVDDTGLLQENYEMNLKTDYSSINIILEQFRNKCNKEYVIVAAGPSLDYDLDLLKENRDNFIIVSVGTALRSLMNRGIKPDIISIIDGKEAVAKQLNGYEDIGIPLCFLSTASRWAVRKHNGPKYMFYNSAGEDDVIIHTGKTVAVACISIALKCGAKKIILLGQDLAYINGKSHTKTYEKTYGYKDNPTINNHCKLVKGVNGEILETTEGYIYFKNQIEKIIDRNKNVDFINCSKGAFIEGAKHMEFKEYTCKNI